MSDVQSTEVLLIRHGQSENNALPEHLRVPDPGLTAVGRQQAQATAAWLGTRSLTSLYCSPFLRSLETVRPIAETTGLTVRVRGDLFELGGCYSGHTSGSERGEAGLGRQQLQARYPGWEIDENIADSGWWGRDYEQLEQGRLRAAQVAAWLAAEIATQEPGKHALVIHADFKRLLLEALLAVDSLDQLRLTLGGNVLRDDGQESESQRSAVPWYNTGISTLQWQGGRWHLQTLNTTTHLPPHFLT
ncbi:MAG: histidine phosphatase family protein [Planctomycetales bacterium]|nr:histidine phosphatase family protein [Planctomycetales bacterium]